MRARCGTVVLGVGNCRRRDIVRRCDPNACSGARTRQRVVCVHLVLDHDGYAKERPVVVQDDLSHIEFTLENRTGGPHRTRLSVAGLPARDYVVTVDGRRTATIKGTEDAQNILLPVGAAPTSHVTIARSR